MDACKRPYESCLPDRSVYDGITIHVPSIPLIVLFSGPPRSSGVTGVSIENKWIAPNTTLHMPTYAMHRDPANFGLGDQFVPERWLDDSDFRKSADVKPLPFNRDAFVPFSAGYASCVGKHLALQNIKCAASYCS